MSTTFVPGTHNAGANAAFIDGHVDYMKWTVLVSPGTQSRWTRRDD
jgi:prepilin-type processing-associated H-X9-DG protein